MSYLNHNLPDWSCYIRNEFLYNHQKGHGEVSRCDVHSVASMEKRVPLFECFLENGVNWTRRPLHALCWRPDAEIEPLNQIMYWDCFSSYIDVQRRNRLAGLKAELIRPDNTKVKGDYMFTLDWGFENKAMTDFNYSETPEHKCAHVFKVETGNYYAYPNNRIIWYDSAWTFKRINSNPGYEIDSTVYSVENTRTFETSNHYIYIQTPTEETVDEKTQPKEKVIGDLPAGGLPYEAPIAFVDANKYWDDLACVTCGKQKPQTSKRLDEKVKEKEKSSAVEFEFDR